MGLFDAIDIAGSGLSAERIRMDVTSENLANAQTTRPPTASPTSARRSCCSRPARRGFSGALQARSATRSAERRPPGGVQVAGIVTDTTPDQLVYDPGNPEANKQGYVKMPNVSTVTEMIDLIAESQLLPVRRDRDADRQVDVHRTLGLLK